MQDQVNKKAEEIRKAMYEMYRTEGIEKLVNTYSEFLAFQYVLNEINVEVYKDISKRINDRKD